MDYKTLSIIIPVYNEEKTIHLILNKIKEVQLINGLNKEMAYKVLKLASYKLPIKTKIVEKT